MAKQESEPKTALGARIRDVRRQLGDPERAAFADVLGISKNTLAYYERGERTPDAITLAAYNEKFRINLNWLVTGRGEMFEAASVVLDGNSVQLLHNFQKLPENRQPLVFEILTTIINHELHK